MNEIMVTAMMADHQPEMNLRSQQRPPQAPQRPLLQQKGQPTLKIAVPKTRPQSRRRRRSLRTRAREARKDAARGRDITVSEVEVSSPYPTHDTGRAEEKTRRKTKESDQKISLHFRRTIAPVAVETGNIALSTPIPHEEAGKRINERQRRKMMRTVERKEGEEEEEEDGEMEPEPWGEKVTNLSCETAQERNPTAKPRSAGEKGGGGGKRKIRGKGKGHERGEGETVNEKEIIVGRTGKAREGGGGGDGTRRNGKTAKEVAGMQQRLQRLYSRREVVEKELKVSSTSTI